VQRALWPGGLRRYPGAVEVVIRDIPSPEEARTCARCRQLKVDLEPLDKPGTVGEDGALLHDLYCQDCLIETRRDDQPAGGMPPEPQPR